VNIAAVTATDLPLIVDLDGTLVPGDTLVEHFIQALGEHPLRTIVTLGLIGKRAAFKEALAGITRLDVTTLPYRDSVLELIAQARRRGQPVHLVTAAHQSIAEDVAAHLGVFDSATGSKGATNLKGKTKSDCLKQQFPQGFVYAGDSAADLDVWPDAAMAVLVGKGDRYASRMQALGTPFQVIDPCISDRTLWIKQLRVHQWSKNLLIFLPMLMAHRFDLSILILSIAIFAIVSALSSATYIINDIVDLSADRRHPSKRKRPLASGTIGIVPAALVAISLIAISFGWALSVSIELALAMLVYLITTLAYSFSLKRIPLLDVTVIATLFTLRLVMGSALLSNGFSPWLLAFSGAFFLSLALAKRHVELMRSVNHGSEAIAGRGWRASDWPISLAFGIASAMVSVLVLVLYVQFEAQVGGLYRYPDWLYCAPVAVMLWCMRIWLLAHRKELDDDPVTFALVDRPSHVLGGLIAVAFVLATW
jgi:4-hydroxybenzoate polyprenyltransferase/phosphoserine phosphatase